MEHTQANRGAPFFTKPVRTLDERQLRADAQAKFDRMILVKTSNRPPGFRAWPFIVGTGVEFIEEQV